MINIIRDEDYFEGTNEHSGVLFQQSEDFDYHPPPPPLQVLPQFHFSIDNYRQIFTVQPNALNSLSKCNWFPK